MIKLCEKKRVKDILSALEVTLLGLALLSLAFVLDFLFQMLMRHIIELFVALGPETMAPWFSPLMHLSFAILISVLSWLVFKSKIGMLFKSSFLMVLLATVLLTIEMFLYRWLFLFFIIGGLIVAGVIYYLYSKKQHWLYYYSAALISIALTALILSRVEIRTDGLVK